MQVVYNTTSLKQRKRDKNNKKYKLKKTQTMKKNTMEYTAPEMEIVSVVAECGVYISSDNSDILYAGEELYEDEF